MNSKAEENGSACGKPMGANDSASRADRGRMVASAIALIASAALLAWAALHSQF